MTDVQQLPNVFVNIWIWIGFAVFIIFALTLDNFVLQKKISHPYQSMRTSLYWTLGWMSCALIFNCLLWLYLATYYDTAFANKKALEFFTGYLIEESLSMDNLFTFYIIFQQLKIPLPLQQRVFSYGIYSAVFLRLIVILFGVYIIDRFHWVLYLMGLFLLFTGFKLFFTQDKTKKEDSLLHSRLYMFMQKYLRFTHEMRGQQFFIVKNNLIYATPLLTALIFIELSDVAFALDSIPAIFAITRDPFIVWTSNIFAILGLRALYFFIANMVQRFYLLKYGIASILLFVGFKIILEPWFRIPIGLSLATIIFILFLFSLLSFALPLRSNAGHLKPNRKEHHDHTHKEHDDYEDKPRHDRH